jgi:pimeloyl-ACP methyl ester carboxylesterase
MREHQQFAVVHGYRRAFLRAGSGPAVLLIHGIGDSSETWEDVVPLLAKTHTVLAPDLLGHGDSDKPRADYSVGGFANGLRDLLVLQGIESATVVGHSLGGGIALQLAYQYPYLCERLVLVASGGFGSEVTPVLRAAALPGAGLVIGASAHPAVRVPAVLALSLAAKVGVLDRTDVREVTRIWSTLRDSSTRSAFLRTLRTVVDVRGQSVSSHDRLYLAAAIPLLLVWGDRDPVLPVAHASKAAEALTSCQVEIIAKAGHLPHRADPDYFTELLEKFIASNDEAVHDPLVWRDLLARGAV